MIQRLLNSARQILDERSGADDTQRKSGNCTSDMKGNGRGKKGIVRRYKLPLQIRGIPLPLQIKGVPLRLPISEGQVLDEKFQAQFQSHDILEQKPLDWTTRREERRRDEEKVVFGSLPTQPGKEPRIRLRKHFAYPYFWESGTNAVRFRSIRRNRGVRVGPGSRPTIGKYARINKTHRIRPVKWKRIGSRNPNRTVLGWQSMKERRQGRVEAARKCVKGLSIYPEEKSQIRTIRYKRPSKRIRRFKWKRRLVRTFHANKISSRQRQPRDEKEVDILFDDTFDSWDKFKP